MTTGVDRRRAPRLPLAVPVRTQTRAPKLLGVTRDVSAGGLYIYTESEDLREGSRIQFVFDFPAELTGHTATAVCGGTVVRVERVESRFGIAVRIDRFSFAEKD